MPGVTGDSTPSLSCTCVLLGWIREMGKDRKNEKGGGREREELWPFLIILDTFQPPEKHPVWTPQWPSGMNLGWDSVFLPVSWMTCHLFIPGVSHLAQEPALEPRGRPRQPTFQTKMSADSCRRKPKGTALRAHTPENRHALHCPVKAKPRIYPGKDSVRPPEKPVWGEWKDHNANFFFIWRYSL